jgi:hypothetical protein
LITASAPSISVAQVPSVRPSHEPFERERITTSSPRDRSDRERIPPICPLPPGITSFMACLLAFPPFV